MSETVRRYTAEFAGQKKLYKAYKLTKTILLCQLSFGFIGVITLILFSNQIGGLLSETNFSNIIIICSIAIWFELILNIFISILAGLQNFVYVTIIGIIKSLLLLLASIILYMFGLSIHIMLEFIIIVNLAAGILALLLVNKERNQLYITSESDKINLKKIFNYSFSVYIILLLDLLVWQRSGIFFLNLWSNSTQVGYYALGASIAYMAVGTIPLSLTGILMPALAERWGASDIDNIRSIFVSSVRVILLISLPICFGGIFLSKPLIIYVFGIEYANTVEIIPYLLLSSLMVIVASPASSTLHAIRRVNFLIVTVIITGILNVLLSYLFIPQLDAEGAALVSMIVRTIGAMLLFIYLGKLLSVNYPYKRMLANFGAAIICGFTAWLVIFNNDGIIYLIIGIIVGIIVYLTGVVILGVLTKDELLGVKKYLVTISKSA